MPDPAAPGVPAPLRVAVALIVLEAVALLGGGLFLVLDTVIGTPGNVARALLGAAFAVLGAAALLWGARLLARLRASARSPVVVLQILALPVGYSLGFQAGRIEIGGPIMLVALAVLFLLFVPATREVLDREM